MSPEQDVQVLAGRLEALESKFDALQRELKFKGPWVSVKDAARELGKSPRAFWQWRERHGIVAQNGFVARLDVDKAIKQRRAAKVPATAYRKRVG